MAASELIPYSRLDDEPREPLLDLTPSHSNS